MTKLTKELIELNKKQREGLDQTANYSALFNGNSRIVNMAKIDAVKVKVQRGAFYLSQLKSVTADEYLVIDMHQGQIYKINKKLYTVKVADDNILVINKQTGEKTFLIVDGKLEFGNIKHLGIENYTYMSGRDDFKGFPALRIDNNYKDSIRIHWIIALMKWGIKTLNKCEGNSPTLRLRRKITFTNSGDNSISNLEIKGGIDNYKGENY